MIRVSGPAALKSVKALTCIDNIHHRCAQRTRIVDYRSREVIDFGLVLCFLGPQSFTGEDVAEFHVHGGIAVISGVLDALGSMSELRPAESGEFTRRAFLNGKMDLVAVEGLADLIDAETAAQRRQALRQLSGANGILYDKWRDVILRALAKLEAYIDFPDEELPRSLWKSVEDSVWLLASEISQHLNDGRRGERLREGIVIAILGPPNAGKSSLINSISRKDVAIVAAEAGTTRDVVEVHLDLDGYPVILADTAGIREAESVVEKEGVRRALERARHADLKLVVVDVSNRVDIDRTIRDIIDDDTILVLNKSDLLGSGRMEWEGADVSRGKAVLVSTLSGAGIEDLLSMIKSEVANRMSSGEMTAITRSRHRIALTDCKDSLDRCVLAPLPELAADDLRHAATALGGITGRIGVEDVLDAIFREFCIGK